jgi:haloacetate dehalogenase
VLWAKDGPIDEWYDDALEIWRQWGVDVRGGPLDGGHFLPDQTYHAFYNFFTE